MRSATDMQLQLDQPPLTKGRHMAFRQASLKTSVNGRWALWCQRWATRRQLLALSPAQLLDIGLTSAQQRQEGRKPFWRE